MSSDAMAANSSIEKVSIIVSKGSLEGVYPALIMANGGTTFTTASGQPMTFAPGQVWTVLAYR